MGYDDIDYGDGLIHVADTAYNMGISDGRHGDSRVTKLEKVSPEVRNWYWEGYQFATRRNEERGYSTYEPMTIGTPSACPDGHPHQLTYDYNNVTGQTVATCLRCRRHLG